MLNLSRYVHAFERHLIVLSLPPSLPPSLPLSLSLSLLITGASHVTKPRGIWYG